MITVKLQVFDRKNDTKHGLDDPSITENFTVLRIVPACEEEEEGGGGGAVGSPLLDNSRTMLLSIGLHSRKR